jgi:hypothetical protein
MPKAGGKWNIFEITAKGRQVTVILNGKKTAELQQRHVRPGADCASARRRRDQVLQGCDQAAVTRAA